MKISVFSPHGSYGRESGVLYLVANYLLRQGAEGFQLRCDGAVAACGRDKKHNWNRTPFSCTRCMSEQKATADWATLRAKTLSSFLIPDDIVQSKKWIASVKRSDLLQSEFRGIPLWELCKDDINARFGGIDVAAASPSQDLAIRDLMLSAVHTLVSVDRFVTTVAPTLHLIAGGSDTLSAAYKTVVQKGRLDAAVFSYDAQEEVIAVESLLSGARYNTKLILDNITTMRTDPKTWAPEVTAIMHEMLTFLGFAPDKIPAV
jgi:hypothetical protein